MLPLGLLRPIDPPEQIRRFRIFRIQLLRAARTSARVVERLRAKQFPRFRKFRLQLRAELLQSDALLRFLHRLSNCRIFAQQFSGSAEGSQTFPKALLGQKLERGRSFSLSLVPFCLAHPFCIPLGHCLPQHFDRFGAIRLELQDLV